MSEHSEHSGAVATKGMAESKYVPLEASDKQICVRTVLLANKSDRDYRWFSGRFQKRKVCTK
jgi:hypothetical protein